MSLTQKGQTKAAIRIGKKGDWTSLKLGEEKEIKIYEETERKRRESLYSAREEL